MNKNEKLKHMMKHIDIALEDIRKDMEHDEDKGILSYALARSMLMNVAAHTETKDVEWLSKQLLGEAFKNIEPHLHIVDGSKLN